LIESAPGRAHRDVDVFRIAGRNFGNDLRGGRVDDGHGLAADGRLLLAVDEHAGLRERVARVAS
jgi:hypothetical protein